MAIYYDGQEWKPPEPHSRLPLGKVAKILITSSALALAVTFFAIALGLYGLISMGLARVMLALAWIVLVCGVLLSDYLCRKSWKHILAVTGVVAIVFGALFIKLDRYATTRKVGVDVAIHQGPALTVSAPRAGKITKTNWAKYRTPSPQARTHVTQQQSSGNQSPNINVEAPQATYGPQSPIVNGGSVTYNPDINPNASVTVYDFNGISHTTQGNVHVASDPRLKQFQQLGQLLGGEKWQQAIDLCEQQKQEVPEWLTPYYVEGDAYAHLCNKEKAVENFSYFVSRVADSKTYQPAKADAERKLQLLSQGVVDDCSRPQP